MSRLGRRSWTSSSSVSAVARLGRNPVAFFKVNTCVVTRYEIQTNNRSTEFSLLLCLLRNLCHISPYRNAAETSPKSTTYYLTPVSHFEPYRIDTRQSKPHRGFLLHNNLLTDLRYTTRIGRASNLKTNSHLKRSMQTRKHVWIQ